MPDEIRYCGECRYFEESFDVLGFCSLKGDIVWGEEKACKNFAPKEVPEDAQ